LPTILKLYVSGAVLVGCVEGTIVLPANFHVGRRVSNINKLKISNESSTTGVSCISNKTIEEMFPQDGVSNQTIYAADEPTTDGCTNKFTTKKPTQPCYIRQNVWHKQMGTHIANLQVLGKAPSDGCTVVHVLSQCELDEMVEHGAQVIHLGTREKLGQTDLWRLSLPLFRRARMLTALVVYLVLVRSRSSSSFVAALHMYCRAGHQERCPE